MGMKKKKFDPSKKYNFNLETGSYVIKEKYMESTENPAAIIYVRVSDQKQVDEWDWLKSQESTSRRWKDRWKDVSVLKVFTDSAISGKNLDRKWLNEAIEYLKQQNSKSIKIKYFLCTEISRISRSEDIRGTIEMKKRIESTGVDIITTSNWRNITDGTLSDSFMSDFEMIRAKFESLQIGERSMNGSKSKLYAGQWIFHPPVGYERIHVKVWTKTEKIIQMVEPQASIVKEWLESFANGIFMSNKQLMHFFNDKKLQSNYHSPNPWKLNLTFVKRMFEIERLYFYAGRILYPNYWVTDPVEAIHTPLISLSTVHKILKRLNIKWWLKFWPRKDTSDRYPLRWLITCPCCNFPMTGRPSTGKMGKIYYYYGCNRKDCEGKENINVDDMHTDFKELLASLSPKKWVIAILDWTLKETIAEKNKFQISLNEAKRRRIKEIEKEIEEFPGIISKLSRIEMIQKIEEKRAGLEMEQDTLKEEIKEKNLNERDFIVLYERVKNIIQDPLSIWELGSTPLKMLLVGVLFWWKIFYKKNEGFKTPQISALYAILGHLEGGEMSCGAGDETRTRNSLLGRQAL